ncbi:MAG: hypothetical protein ACE5GH_07960, partial [Fidelibacterota bacterium]
MVNPKRDPGVSGRGRRLMEEIEGEPDVPGPPARVITEDFTNHMAFNIMPRLLVEETLFIKEYRIWDRYMEA